MPKDIKRKMIYIVKNNNNDRHKVNEVIEQVKQSGGIAYTAQKMLEYRDEALQILQQFPETPAREAMVELVNYVIDRKY